MRGKPRLLWTMSILLAAAAASAQEPPPDGDNELAKIWANKAKERFDAGDYQGAIDGIREGERHARPPTFKLLSAQAHERLGKLLEAQRLYQFVIDLKLESDAPPAWVNAQKAARQGLEALLPRIPKLRISVIGADIPTLDLQIDGKAFDPGQIDRNIPQDPGAHTILVRPRDGEAVTRRVAVREGTTEVVAIKLAEPPPLPVPVQPEDKGPLVIKPLVPPLYGYGAFALGAAGLLTGAVAGISVLSQVGPISNGPCRLDLPDKPCSQRAKDGIESVGALADLATAGFILAGVGLAAGTVVMLLPGKKERPVALAVWPGGLALRGAF